MLRWKQSPRQNRRPEPHRKQRLNRNMKQKNRDPQRRRHSLRPPRHRLRRRPAPATTRTSAALCPGSWQASSCLRALLCSEKQGEKAGEGAAEKDCFIPDDALKPAQDPALDPAPAPGQSCRSRRSPAAALPWLHCASVGHPWRHNASLSY